MDVADAAVAERLDDGLRRVVAGNDRAIFGLLVALLARGHVLIEGVPGTAKTLLVRALARLAGLEFRRIQFTPDLMPSDIIGTTVFDQQHLTFSPRFGPIVANLVLADEINRAGPKTQAALLEAMEERQLTIDGTSTPLPDPFMVCATQNPVEFEGTYPLPEAQLDRFTIKVSTDYPSAAEERALLARAAAGFDATRLETAGVERVASADEIRSLQDRVGGVHTAPDLLDYVYAIVAQTRSTPDIELGASPRAGLALLQATRASAVLEGRDFATPDDVKATAPLVLTHRLMLRAEAEVEGITSAAVIARILETVPVPVQR